MKRIAIMIPVLAIASIVNSGALGSEVDSTMGIMQGNISTQKDECILASLNCTDNVSTLQHRIDRLQAEINKGSAVYTDGELHILNNKLIDAQSKMNELEYDQ